MALEATFRELSEQIYNLLDSWEFLDVTMRDQPEDQGTALADAMDNSVLDLVGMLLQARKAALSAAQAVVHPLDLDRARRELTVCQERFHGMEQKFAADLVSYDKLRGLAQLGGERGGEWLAWAGITKQAIEECRQPLQAVSIALAACWQELAERVGMTSINVRSTSIGQKIDKEALESAEALHQGVT